MTVIVMAAPSMLIVAPRGIVTEYVSRSSPISSQTFILTGILAAELLGATINMDGAAITITVMTMATAFTLGIHVDIPTAIILSLLAALSACGASGVAGGSLLLIPMACSLFGISDDVSMQVVAVGFIIGVIQDSVETALNSSSDLLLSASAEFRQWRLEGKEIKF